MNTEDIIKFENNAGNERFDRIERELKETNGLLRELVGMFKATTRAMGHTPEERSF